MGEVRIAHKPLIVASTRVSYHRAPPSGGRFGSWSWLSWISCLGCVGHLIAANELMNAEAELVVLRHQLMVLKRQVGRPRLRLRDRLFMAAISRALPRARWSSFVVSLSVNAG